MKITKSFLFFIIVMTFLAACIPDVPEATAMAVEAPVTEAASTSTPETIASPTDNSPADGEFTITEEDAVLSAFSQPVMVAGELLVLYGHVLDGNGAPLSGYAVEIWQVDANGSYDHPNDPSTQNRDRNFQFFGTSLTDENGLFSFRTLVPARYEPRPRHIHFKVKVDGRDVITSQFYFAEDVEAAQFGPSGEMLLLTMTETQDGAGNKVVLAFKDIAVDTGAGGDLPLTPLQQEGPYYPVVDVSQFDNDLVNIQ